MGGRCRGAVTETDVNRVLTDDGLDEVGLAMLPSTGHFKGINCPFLESGLCERPYCHFKHAKREAPSQPLLRQLVTSAVKRLMRPASVDADTSEFPEFSPLPPSPPSPPAAKPTYNPTPISELNRSFDRREEHVRRHIPIPYTPSRPIRSAEGYVPFGGPPSTATYNPGGAAQPRDEPAYSPVSAPISSPSPSPFPFVPQMTFMKYKPTPLRRDTPAFSSDEDEPAAKKTRTDEVDLDGMEPEFEMLGQIIDDEKETDKLDEKRTTHLKEKNHKSSSSKNDRSRKSDKAKKSDSSSSKDKRSSGKSDDSKKRDSRSNDKKSKDTGGSKSSKGTRHESSDKRRSSPKNGTKPNFKDNAESKRENDRKRDRIRSEAKVRKSHDEMKKPDRKQSVDDILTDGEDALSVSESDEDKIAEECLKIFEEYVPAPKENTKVSHVVKNLMDDDVCPANSKKRIARSNDRPTNKLAPVSLPPNHRGNAIQLAVDRYSKVKQFHEARLKSTEITNRSIKSDPPVPVTTGSSKIRIAHVPNVSTMLNAKKNISKVSEPPKVTSVQTVSKGVSRVAHIPNEKFCDRPGVLEPLASKIPVNVRSKYLNMMIDECLKIYLTVEDAYERAQQEELATSKKCKATQIYKNSAILAITRLRKEVKETNGIKKSNIDMGTSTISHNQILVGKLGEKSSWSIESKSKKDFQFTDELKGVKFYNNIARWLMSEKELQENGFPRPHPHSKEKGRAIIYTKNTKQKPPKGNIRFCRRCGKEYAVDKKGFPIVKEECIYHPNNKYRYRGEVKYQCCSQDGTSDGCLSASTHVYEYVNHDDLRGFVRTVPKDNSDNLIDHGVYALDCEMCYTTHGLDLTRVTVIDSSCKVIYESLVKPLYPIIDYNTRYSGLTEEMFSDCNTTLLEVQATFLHMFSNKTILVGHSLESDFKALKLIHDSIVDTSVLFPHKMGLPYKRALRNLSSEYLKKIIQNSVDGHDSAEDALVCMELIIWKLKEELKLR